MRSELALGIVGGILGITFALIGYFVIFLGWGVLTILAGKEVAVDVSLIAGLAWSAIFGSMLGIVGGAIGKPKIGGIVMVAGAILILISLVGSWFYVLNIVPFILILVGGIMALRRKLKVATAPITPPPQPTQLPLDVSRTQYTILRTIREGTTKAKDIAKNLSMDKKAVEKEIEELKVKGYLSKDGKLTSKGLEIVQQ